MFSAFQVPNTSFQVYAPSFMENFLELHAVMFQVILYLIFISRKCAVQSLLSKMHGHVIIFSCAYQMLTIGVVLYIVYGLDIWENKVQLLYQLRYTPYLLHFHPTTILTDVCFLGKQWSEA